MLDYETVNIKLPFSFWDSKTDNSRRSVRCGKIAVLLLRFCIEQGWYEWRVPVKNCRSPFEILYPYSPFPSSLLFSHCRSPFEILLVSISTGWATQSTSNCRSPFEIQGAHRKVEHHRRGQRNCRSPFEIPNSRKARMEQWWKTVQLPFSFWDSSKFVASFYCVSWIVLPFSFWDSCPKCGALAFDIVILPFSFWDSWHDDAYRIVGEELIPNCRSPFEIHQHSYTTSLGQRQPLPFSFWDSLEQFGVEIVYPQIEEIAVLLLRFWWRIWNTT